MRKFWSTGLVFVAISVAWFPGVASATPQETAPVNDDNAAAWSGEIGGAVGVAFADAEGIATGPLLGVGIGRALNDNWVSEGQFRAWVGRPSEGEGRDPDYRNEQWMSTFRALYLLGCGNIRPLIGFGG